MPLSVLKFATTNSWRSSVDGAAGCPAALVAGRRTMLRTMANSVFIEVLARSRSSGFFGADAIEVRVGPHEDRSAGHRDRREGITIDSVAGQQAELVARFDDGGRSFLIQEIDPAIRIDRRR